MKKALNPEPDDFIAFQVVFTCSGIIKLPLAIHLPTDIHRSYSRGFACYGFL